jgi:hypothetical protein
MTNYGYYLLVSLFRTGGLIFSFSFFNRPSDDMLPQWGDQRCGGRMPEGCKFSIRSVTNR